MGASLVIGSGENPIVFSPGRLLFMTFSAYSRGLLDVDQAGVSKCRPELADAVALGAEVRRVRKRRPTSAAFGSIVSAQTGFKPARHFYGTDVEAASGLRAA
jgi:hypothetical protein